MLVTSEVLFSVVLLPKGALAQEADKLDRISLLGVSFYFGDPPKCEAGETEVRIEATVGYFQRQFALKEVLQELAREARSIFRESGRPPIAIHSITIIDATPGFQINAAAFALRCVSGESPDNNLLELINNSDRAIVYSLSGLSPDSIALSVDRATKLEIGRINADNELSRVMSIVHRTMGKIDEISRPCPFIPDYGISFDTGPWFLVSTTCESGAIAQVTDDWRELKQHSLVDLDIAWIKSFTGRGSIK
jgi:hypothetical protein